MKEYKLELKQIVDYPSCRMYRECWKLMGLTFEDCDKARNIGVADTNLYKQAGNGIVTNCVKLLAEHLYKSQYDDTYVCTDERMVLTENFMNPPTN